MCDAFCREPCIYLNGIPCVYRDFDAPYTNMQYTGITAERVDRLERALAQDIRQEMQRFGGKVLLHGETGGGKLFGYWEVLHRPAAAAAADGKSKSEAGYADAVQTCDQTYSYALSGDAFVTHMRVPITDEQSPEPEDFDTIIRTLDSFPSAEKPLVIFNCQQGRGRTTTGTVIASLWHAFRQGTALPSTTTSPSDKQLLSAKSSSDSKIPAAATTQPGTAASTSAATNSHAHGWFPAIRQLVAVLSQGRALKKLVDAIIDQCSVMVHLRTCIDETLHKLRPDVRVLLSESRAKELKEKGLWAMQRYFMLLSCAAYLHERTKRPAPTAASQSSALSDSLPQHVSHDPNSFAHWFSARKELQSMYRALTFPF